MALRVARGAARWATECDAMGFVALEVVLVACGAVERAEKVRGRGE